MAVMTEKEITKYYDAECEAWVKDITKEPKKYVYSSYFQTLFQNAKGSRTLDIGCGAGIFTFELAKFADELHAFDLSQAMIDKVQQEAKKRNMKVHTKIGDISKMPYPDNHFDFIVSVGVMECLNNPDQALKEIRRILKPGGKAAIRWMSDTGLWVLFEDLKRGIGHASGPFAHNHIPQTEVVSRLRKAGFEIRRVQGMIVFPVFMFPRIIIPVLSLIFIRTKLSYLLEKICKNKLHYLFYSYCTEIT